MKSVVPPFSRRIALHLARGSALYAASVLLERLITLLLVPVLTKTLPPELYGAWTQLVILASLFGHMVSLGLHNAGVRFMGGESHSRYGASLLHAILALGLANGLLVVLLFSLAPQQLAGWFYGDPALAGFVYALAALVLADALLEAVLVPLRARDRIGLLSCYLLLRYSVRLAVLALGTAWLGIDLVTLIMLGAGFQLLLAVWIYGAHLFGSWEAGGWSFRLVRWRELCAYSLPIAAASLLVWANNVIDRFVVLHVLDLTEVAVYALANSLVSAVGLLSVVLVYNLYPAMAARYNEGRNAEAAEHLAQAVTLYGFLAVPAAAIVTLFGVDAIRLLATERYLVSWLVLLWLSLGAVAFGFYSLYACGLFVLKRSTAHLRVTALAGVANLILNIALVPRFGIEGAALATFCSNLLLLTAVYWTVRGAAPGLAPAPFGVPSLRLRMGSPAFRRPAGNPNPETRNSKLETRP